MFSIFSLLLRNIVVHLIGGINPILLTGDNRTPKNVPLIHGVAEIINPPGFNNSFILCITFGVFSTKWSR